MNELQIQVNREVSEKIRDHLIEQRARALTSNGSACMYRGHGGTMCAVGCLIPDDRYRERFENTYISYESPIWNILREEYGGYLLLEILSRWQRYHDSHEGGDDNYQKWLDKVPGATSPEEFHDYLMEELQSWYA